jgi:hypothetical protein
VIVTPPGLVPFTVTEQELPDKVQVVCRKITLPEPPVFDQVIVSPFTDPVNPDKVAVQTLEVATANVVGTQDTVVVVVALTVRGSHELFEGPSLESPV